MASDDKGPNGNQEERTEKQPLKPAKLWLRTVKMATAILNDPKSRHNGQRVFVGNGVVEQVIDCFDYPNTKQGMSAWVTPGACLTDYACAYPGSLIPVNARISDRPGDDLYITSMAWELWEKATLVEAHTWVSDQIVAAAKRLVSGFPLPAINEIQSAYGMKDWERAEAALAMVEKFEQLLVADDELNGLNWESFCVVVERAEKAAAMKQVAVHQGAKFAGDDTERVFAALDTVLAAKTSTTPAKDEPAPKPVPEPVAPIHTCGDAGTGETEATHALREALALQQSAPAPEPPAEEDLGIELEEPAPEITLEQAREIGREAIAARREAVGLGVTAKPPSWDKLKETDTASNAEGIVNAAEMVKGEITAMIEVATAPAPATLSFDEFDDD